MSHSISKKIVYGCLLVLLAVQSNASDYSWNKIQSYKITITNITKNVSFTPFILASHKPGLEIFELGAPASQEIADIAEGGDIAPLTAMLEASEQVKALASTDGLLAAGDSVEIMLESGRAFRFLSLASMLLPTNDSFVALNGVLLPRFGSVTYYAQAYDAGSETNDESCMSIPGPVCGGEPFSPNDAGEGFVHIANGISGEGDLSAALYDWRGPVAKITIEKM